MTTNYDKYQYLWPPRPEVKIPQTALPFYEARRFWAQVKKNGTCTVIFSRGDEVIFKTRHNDDHKLWSPEKDHLRFFRDRGGQKGKWNVYVAELLHSKVTNGPKHELFINDILVSNGVQLTGKTFAERQDILFDRWTGKNEGDQLRVDDRITLANSYQNNFAERFKHLKPEDEGLVLKNPTAKLAPCFKANSNTIWQVKCRITTRNYSF